MIKPREKSSKNNFAMPQKIRMSIGEFSKFCQVTVKTLRHYDKLGLLVPNEVDEWSHYRYYDVSQMQRLNAILRLKNLGFSLEEIGNMLNEGTDKPSISQVEAKIRSVEEQIQKLNDKLAILRQIDNYLRRINDMDGISIQSLPSVTVASYRRVLKHRDDLTPIFTKTINPEIQRIGCKRSLPIYGFVIEHEQTYKTEEIDTEYCLQVEQMYADTEIIKFRRLPAVPMAVCLKHVGSYDSFSDSYAEVMQFIADNGYQQAGEYRIQFEDSIQNQSNPQKYVTILQVPVISDAVPEK
jgi:DNA-binding transcriptional MerR regulator